MSHISAVNTCKVVYSYVPPGGQSLFYMRAQDQLYIAFISPWIPMHVCDGEGKGARGGGVYHFCFLYKSPLHIEKKSQYLGTSTSQYRTLPQLEPRTSWIYGCTRIIEYNAVFWGNREQAGGQTTGVMFFVGAVVARWLPSFHSRQFAHRFGFIHIFVGTFGAMQSRESL